jgi:hypothetical protein
MITKQKNVQFVAPSGNILVYRGGRPSRDGDILLSTNRGASFEELAGYGFSGRYFGDEIDAGTTVQQLSTGLEIKLHQVNQTISFMGEVYVQQELPIDLESANVTRLPTSRVPDILCVDVFGQFYYLDRLKYNWGYSTMKFYIGQGSSMVEHENQGVTRYRDGGTTDVKTPAGNFHWPTPFNESLVPFWTPTRGNAIQLKGLKHADYVFTYTPDGVIITAR